MEQIEIRVLDYVIESSDYGNESAILDMYIMYIPTKKVFQGITQTIFEAEIVPKAHRTQLKALRWLLNRKRSEWNT
jgi:hypothetical protein